MPLTGGTTNRGLVFRRGDTVRRPAQVATGPRALLAHLAAVDFAGAPRHLGYDDQGREVLSYVPGQAVTPPYPPWATTDAALLSVAALLRRYHEAAAGFDASAHTWSKPVPAQFAGDVVTHNDPNLDNVVFRDGLAVALIDFDLAAPGSAVWDVAAAVRLWAPLREVIELQDDRRGRVLTRFRRFVDTYGLTDAEREKLPAAVSANHDWCYRIVEVAVHQGHDAFTQFWREGGALNAEHRREWYAQNAAVLRAALDLDPPT